MRLSLPLTLLLLGGASLAALKPATAQEAEVREYEVRIERKETSTETVEGEVEVLSSVEVDRARYLDRVERQDAAGKALTRVQFLIEAERSEVVRMTIDGKLEGEPDREESKSALSGRHLRWSGLGAPELEVQVLGEPKVGLSWDFSPAAVVLDGQVWLQAKAQAHKLSGLKFRALPAGEAFQGLPAEVREEFLLEVAAGGLARGEGSLVRVEWSVARATEPAQSVTFRLLLEAKSSAGEVIVSEVELRLTQRKPSRAFPPLP